MTENAARRAATCSDLATDQSPSIRWVKTYAGSDGLILRALLLDECDD
jgi:hypothetical protein